ncbi:hypothetical protein ACW9H6_14325 [Pseudomonas sp. SDO528_S397]
MYKKHTPQRPDGFAKYRNRQHATPRPTFHPLPPAKLRALRRNVFFVGMTLGLVIVIGLLSKAYAAGGAYVVDDGAINDPGQCNVDAWYTANRHDGSTHSQTLSPACTPAGLPWLQAGVAVSRANADGHGETQLSPQFKAQVWSREDAGLALAASVTAHYALNRPHAYDGTDWNLPLTWQPAQALRLSVNAGWSHAYNGGDPQQRATWGTGLEYRLVDTVTLIAERYGQQGGDQAWQAGPRLQVSKDVDVDLVLGRSLIGARSQWLTTGATFRF